ncbi:ABC transporter permease/ATP-binding protein [Mycoplasmopsis californica]|uniref:ABC transporter permease/ATP-binding protein n=2 Tax=Mycoplasmopsis californica TaxID=2113 RepID=A0A059XVP5_9BACT|nr:ABC transporter ATP-binding protein [Mycoplasmopsis californica]AIA29287.1 ABC transporter permease/ATP-binding protein [Mycoplasmopsis californica]
MFKLFKILPRHIKATFVGGSFLALLTVLVGLLMPNFVSQFIKLLFSNEKTHNIELFKGWTIIKDAEAGYLRNLLITIIAIQTLLTGAMTFTFTWIFVWAAENASYFYRVKLFEKINKLSLKNISDLKPESIMTRISNDVAVFWDFLVAGLRMMIKGFIMILGGATIAFFVNPKLAWIVVLVIPIMIAIMLIVGKVISPIIAKSQRQVEAVTKEIDENIKGTRTIKIFNLEKLRNQRFTSTNKLWYKLSVKFNTIISLLYPIFFLINNFIVIGIYAFVRKQVVSGVATDQTVVEMNIFIEYLWIIAFGIMLVTMFIRFAFAAKVSAKRLLEILEAQEDKLFVKNGLELKTEQNNNKLDIKIRNLNFRYYKDNPHYSLTNVNLDVPFQSSLGIIGLFAAGKSTLVSLLLNNYVYDEGSIKIGDKEVNQINTEDLLKTVGIVYQDSMLFAGTIRSNMLWAKPNATDEEIEIALKNACAYEFVNKFDDGLDHPITQGATNLSGGQKQRLSIARTLLRKPKILILDDSTSALDNITTRKVIQNINQNYQCTTILISQKIGALRSCDQIAVMENGRVVSTGKHSELIEKCPFYKQIYRSQLEY